MRFQVDDGGRAAAGFRGQTGDCVCRAIAIATEQPYAEIYAALNGAAQRERPRVGRKRSSARTGVQIPTIRRYLASIGWRWVPTMQVGQGCKVHLRAEELPSGRLIVSVSRHLVAVIDGVVHDTHDPTRGGTRCVYGYYTRQAVAPASAGEGA
jgi:hypothetical protein